MSRILFAMKILSHWSKGQFVSLKTFKYYSRWKAYISEHRSSITDRQAWLTFPAIEFLDQHISHSDKIFEFGGGGSTLFFIDRAAEVITVEHNPEWFEKLSEVVKSPKWVGNIIQPELGKGGDRSNPDYYASDDPLFKGKSFNRYASYIDRFPDDYFDLVLVDGRARPSCIKHAVSKVKKGGYLVLDNAERRYYLSHSRCYLSDFTLVLNKFAPAPYVQHFTQTNIWKKL